MRIRKTFLSLIIAFSLIFSGSINSKASEYVSTPCPTAKHLETSKLFKGRHLQIKYSGTRGKRYEAAVMHILSGIDKGWTDEEKLLYIHDYLITHSTYAYTKSDEPDFTHSFAYDRIVEHYAICNGYAEAFYDLANRAGIHALQIVSLECNHAWNAVKLGGNWYYVDCTFDDIGFTPLDQSHSYDNFLRDESAMRTTGHYGKDWHEAYWTEDYEIGMNLIGKCKSRRYDNAPWRSANMNSSLTFLKDGVAYYKSDDMTVFKYDCNSGKVRKLFRDESLSISSSMTTALKTLTTPRYTIYNSECMLSDSCDFSEAKGRTQKTYNKLACAPTSASGRAS